MGRTISAAERPLQPRWIVLDDATRRIDIGLNYIIDGHNARLSLLYGDVDQDEAMGADFNLLRFGLQLQI